MTKSWNPPPDPITEVSKATRHPARMGVDAYLQSRRASAAAVAADALVDQQSQRRALAGSSQGRARAKRR